MARDAAALEPDSRPRHRLGKEKEQCASESQ